MSFKRMIQAVETHSGEPMRVITGGVPHIPGESVYEQMKWLERNDDQLRSLMLREPRGYPPMCCNLIVPPKHPDAAAGYIIMEQVEYPVMSGGNTIAVATVLLETGMIEMREPVTEFKLEAPAGLIGIRAECRAGKVKRLLPHPPGRPGSAAGRASRLPGDRSHDLSAVRPHRQSGRRHEERGDGGQRSRGLRQPRPRASRSSSACTTQQCPGPLRTTAATTRSAPCRPATWPPPTGAWDTPTPDDQRVAIFAEPRLEGIRRVCAELGLPAPDVRTVPLQPNGAADAVRAWLAADPPVTGICAFNDDVATAVLAGLRRLGLRAPDDLAVIGVDNTPGAAVACPPLTSVVQDFTAIAEHFADLVTAALDGGRVIADPAEHQIRLEIRESA